MRNVLTAVLRTFWLFFLPSSKIFFMHSWNGKNWQIFQKFRKSYNSWPKSAFWRLSNLLRIFNEKIDPKNHLLTPDLSQNLLHIHYTLISVHHNQKLSASILQTHTCPYPQNYQNILSGRCLIDLEMLNWPGKCLKEYTISDYFHVSGHTLIWLPFITLAVWHRKPECWFLWRIKWPQSQARENY